jgi:hypothetical protein
MANHLPFVVALPTKLLLMTQHPQPVHVQATSANNSPSPNCTHVSQRLLLLLLPLRRPPRRHLHVAPGSEWVALAAAAIQIHPWHPSPGRQSDG